MSAMDRPALTSVIETALPNSTNGIQCARVCIATLEINGPNRNGGIGTGYTALAELLSGAGHRVTLLHLRGPYAEQQSFSHWQEHFQEKNIQLVALPESSLRFGGSTALARSYQVYDWLRHQSFDLVHFHEWLGAGYYSLLARHQGLAFEKTQFCVGAHSPTMWIKEANRELIDDIDDLELDAIERRCVELADQVWCPSRHLQQWLQDRGWPIENKVFIRPYLAPQVPQRTTSTSEINELVFFGRLETRKGLVLFCDALDRLAETTAGCRVTFLGKPTLIDGQTAELYIEDRSRQWPFPVEMQTNLDQAQAIDYLQEPGRLAVLPSLLDNAPLALTECLQSGIPFLTTAVGGIPEMIAEEDHDRCLVEPRSDALADRLQAILRQGQNRAQPRANQQSNQTFWQEFHQTIKPVPAPCPNRKPLVSVCLVHYNRPNLLEQALESLQHQDYPSFEVIIVDDGSTDPAAMAYLDQIEPSISERGWRIIRQDNRYLGAARNTAAHQAEGEYLLFMDDDNVAKSHEISRLVAVAERTEADLVTCLMDMFSGELPPREQQMPEPRWLFAGIDSPVGVVRNCFGDANALIRRAAFEAVGGFTEDYGVTHEDWELFARMTLQGYHLEMVPEALFWYRVSPNSMIRETDRGANYARHLRAYLEEMPGYYHDLIRMAQGQALQLQELREQVQEVSGASKALRYQMADGLHRAVEKVPGLKPLLKWTVKALIKGMGALRGEKE